MSTTTRGDVLWTMAAIIVCSFMGIMVIGAVHHYAKLEERFVRVPSHSACSIGKIASSWMYNSRFKEGGSVPDERPYWMGDQPGSPDGYVLWLANVEHVRTPNEWGLPGDTKWSWEKVGDKYKIVETYANSSEKQTFELPIKGANVPASIQKSGGYAYFHRSWKGGARGPAGVYKVTPGVCK